MDRAGEAEGALPRPRPGALQLEAGGGAVHGLGAHQHAVLHRALKQATRRGPVPRNVCDVVDPPRVVGKEITPLDPEQSRTFLEAAHGDRYEALYVVAVTCGLREGELFGLARTDVDLEARTLRVERQL